MEYNVPLANKPNGVNFDGFDAQRGVLLDAKHFSDSHPMINPKTYPVVKTSFEKDLIDQATTQVQTAKGKPIEWHVSNQQAAESVRQLFASRRDLARNIKVIFSPDVVN